MKQTKRGRNRLDRIQKNQTAGKKKEKNLRQVMPRSQTITNFAHLSAPIFAIVNVPTGIIYSHYVRLHAKYYV